MNMNNDITLREVLEILDKSVSGKTRKQLTRYQIQQQALSGFPELKSEDKHEIEKIYWKANFFIINYFKDIYRLNTSIFDGILTIHVQLFEKSFSLDFQLLNNDCYLSTKDFDIKVDTDKMQEGIERLYVFLKR